MTKLMKTCIATMEVELVQIRGLDIPRYRSTASFSNLGISPKSVTVVTAHLSQSKASQRRAGLIFHSLNLSILHNNSWSASEPP